MIRCACGNKNKNKFQIKNYNGKEVLECQCCGNCYETETKEVKVDKLEEEYCKRYDKYKEDFLRLLKNYKSVEKGKGTEINVEIKILLLFLSELYVNLEGKND